MLTSCRYKRAIKQAINKLLKSRSAVHFPIADIIGEFSHKTVVTPGTYLLTELCYFFVVQQIMSPHWCIGFFCPPRVELTDLASLGRFFAPDIGRRGHSCRKRIFEPFAKPHIRRRKLIFKLENKLNCHEPLPP